MKNTNAILLVILLAAVGIGGYALGSHGRAPAVVVASTADPASGPASAPRKLLYYRNPMGLPDTSPTPRKDPMGMDYIPVYEGEEPASDPNSANLVRISTEKVQKLGVRTEAATLRPLGRAVRASGRVEPDERRVSMISPKFEGYVERLHINATGQPVAKGQPLFEVYSPELVSAQREYAIAAQGAQAMKDAGSESAAGMKQLADSALARLRNWDLSPGDVAALAKSGEARRTVTLRSPVSGIVTEKKAFQGMRFTPGEALYQVTDLSSVWVVADVFEQDIGLVKTGAKASVTLPAYPGQTFGGTITYVYPTLKAETRTVPVRIELANPRQLLKPAMFAQVEVQLGTSAPVLTVPDSAVIDSGKRQIVLVQRGEGRFEPREIRTGARGDNHVEVLEGLKAGEEVVVAANFLIDAESNLKAAIGGLGGHAGHGGAAPAATAASAETSTATPTPAESSVGHQGTGRVEGIDAKTGTLTLNHEAIASMKWPAMTMEFQVANPSLLAGLNPGAAVTFEFVERQPGEWVVTRVTPKPAAPASPGSHSGH
ncbi:membrane fusion protein, Cu(I)/Ag(I) efflux system [Variovorax sp. HW608]|uniref:efflux RND transporter periplasmic adaptor subunit n=1 Tax=Variovorax sp. HW608 TaxID=1034889 RepID=UPI00081FEAB8|nr:efflux RND transporter periplasmic adaptor subunit [Variovorax sp. HW608]SCK20552.1 membrane fusion protein, Cu(I)/Ag(I) efflux system [Variovorax sp. HW608]